MHLKFQGSCVPSLLKILVVMKVIANYMQHLKIEDKGIFLCQLWNKSGLLSGLYVRFMQPLQSYVIEYRTLVQKS